MGFDASLLVSGLNVEQVQSEENHYSSFVCNICAKLVSIDSVVASCCLHPFCRKCLESLAMDSFVKRKPCHCPTCNVDMQRHVSITSESSSTMMQFGSVRVAVRPLQDSQPLAYRVLCRVQVACNHRFDSLETCDWVGNYEDFLPHAIICHATTHKTTATALQSQTNVADAQDSSIRTERARSPSRKQRKSVEKHNDEGRLSYREIELYGVLNDSKLRPAADSFSESQFENNNGDFGIKTTSELLKDSTTTTHSDTTRNTLYTNTEWDSNDKSLLNLVDSESETEADVKTLNKSSEYKRTNCQKAERLKKQANAKFNKGNFEEAGKLYTEGINILSCADTRSESDLKLLSNMHSNRAASFYREKKFMECILDCDFALQYEPSVEKAWIRKRRALAISGEMYAALLCIEQAATVIPNSKKIQEESKRAIAELENFTKVKKFMENESTKKDAWRLARTFVDKSENIALLAFTAKVAIEADELDRALETINKVLDMNPNYADGLELRSIWYYLTGDIKTSVTHLLGALIICPDSDEIRATLARVEKTRSIWEAAQNAVKDAQYKEAVEQFTLAITVNDPLPPLSPLLAMLKTGRAEGYLLAKQYLSALKECQEVISARHEHDQAWIVRSEVLIALGRAAEAKKELLFARRTWGAGNPSIEKGFRRVEFEVYVVHADNDILLLQNELDHGIVRKMAHSERVGAIDKRFSYGMESISLEFKHKTKSVRNFLAQPRKLVAGHQSFNKTDSRSQSGTFKTDVSCLLSPKKLDPKKSKSSKAAIGNEENDNRLPDRINQEPWKPFSPVKVDPKLRRTPSSKSPCRLPAERSRDRDNKSPSRGSRNRESMSPSRLQRDIEVKSPYGQSGGRILENKPAYRIQTSSRDENEKQKKRSNRSSGSIGEGSRSISATRSQIHIEGNHRSEEGGR